MRSQWIEPSHYFGVVVKLELDPKMVQMIVYQFGIDDMFLGRVLLSEVKITLSMTGEIFT